MCFSFQKENIAIFFDPFFLKIDEKMQTRIPTLFNYQKNYTFKIGMPTSQKELTRFEILYIVYMPSYFWVEDDSTSPRNYSVLKKNISWFFCSESLYIKFTGCPKNSEKLKPRDRSPPGESELPPSIYLIGFFLVWML